MPWSEESWLGPEYDARFDRVIEGLLIALLAFAPLAFGAVEAWSEEVVIALAAAISICFCLKLVFNRNSRVMWTWAYIPVFAFILVAVLQTIPLPVALVRLVSPQTVAQKMELLAELNGPEGVPSTMTVSFYGHATTHDLRLVLAVAAIFVVVFNTIRRTDQITRLLGAITVIGTLIAIEALAQAVVGNGKIHWFVPVHGPLFFGPFANHSHYAQFMNLSIGATVGLILMKLYQRFTTASVTPATVMSFLGARDGRVVIGLSLIVVLGAASIFVSLSRGGMISTLIAGAFTTLVISYRRSLKGSGWFFALLALGAFICVLYVGFDAVHDRLATLRDLDEAEAGRWQIVKDITVAWTRFPVLGTGLGTHEVVYPMFDRSTVPAIASHAENEYAQTAEETGMVGLLPLIVLGIIVWRSYARTIRSSRTAVHSAAYGLGFGLLAIMIHSLSDFGQHAPANALLSAIFCALLIRLPRVGLDANGSVIVQPSCLMVGRRVPLYRVLGVGGALVLCVLVLLDADAVRRGESRWAKVLRAERDLVDRNWQGSDGEYTYLLSNAVQATECQPSNLKYIYWLNVYRWHAFRSSVADPNTGEIIPSPEGMEIVQRIVDEMKQAAPLCLTYGPLWAVLGQLERLVAPGSEEGARHIIRSRQLAPCDPTVCLVTGTLYADEGDVDRAFDEWQRCVELHGPWFADVASFLTGPSQRPDLAYRLAGDDVGRLAQLETLLKNSDGDVEFIERVGEHILRLLEQACQEPDAVSYEFARLAERYTGLGRMDEAVDTYRTALNLDYDKIAWRYSLAGLLAQQGQLSEAIRELEICLQLRPEFKAASQFREVLLAQMSARSSLD